MKRAEKKDLKRKAIMAAAEALIRQRGSTDFSMPELSKASSLSTATIYNLMTSKPSLLYALLNSSLDTVISGIPARDDDPVERAITASSLAGEIFTRDPDLFKPLYRYLLGVADPVHRPAFMARALAFWQLHLGGLAEHGLLPPGLGLNEFAREHQIYFVGALDLWVQGELSAAGFRAQISFSGIVRLFALANPRYQARLRDLAIELSTIVQAEIPA